MKKSRLQSLSKWNRHDRKRSLTWSSKPEKNWTTWYTSFKMRSNFQMKKSRLQSLSKWNRHDRLGTGRKEMSSSSHPIIPFACWASALVSVVETLSPSPSTSSPPKLSSLSLRASIGMPPPSEGRGVTVASAKVNILIGSWLGRCVFFFVVFWWYIKLWALQHWELLIPNLKCRTLLNLLKEITT